MVKKRGLGKSLDALLAFTDANGQNVVDLDIPNQEKIVKLHVDLLQRGKYQPRREMDDEALAELASSIRQQGIIQPLIVRAVNDKYEIIAGERRWRAAQMAGLSEVPVVIRHLPDEAAIAIALIENIQRENLNPVEEAIALERLIEEFGMTHQQVAEAIGKSRTTVTNLLRLLALPEEIKILLAKGQIEMGHARTLITLPEASQLQIANTVVEKSLSVRDTEQLVRRLQNPSPTNKQKTIEADLIDVQEMLTRQLKLRVALQCNAKGRGKITIHYRSLAELDSVLGYFHED